MEHYAVDKMNLRARETVYWPGISEDIKATYQRCTICAKFARTVQKETLKPHRNTTAQLGQAWFGHFPTKRSTLFTNSQLLQSIPCSMETINSSLPECNQQPKTNLHRNRSAKIYSNRWWHSIYITRVQRFHANMEHRT